MRNHLLLCRVCCGQRLRAVAGVSLNLSFPGELLPQKDFWQAAQCVWLAP